MSLEARTNGSLKWTVAALLAALGLVTACRVGSNAGDDPGPGTATDADGDGDGADGDGDGDGNATGGTGDDTGNDDAGEPGQAPSAKARVKLKTATRYAADLATALDLPRSEVCNELSSYDCFEVHEIALGEVDAYGLRVLEPLEVSPVTAPVAVDRIGLSACGERAARDFDAPGDAIVFAEIAADAAQAELDGRRAVVERLYHRLLLRDVEPGERDAIVDLYDELGEHEDPARTWAQLACFSIATSTEAIFY